MIPADFDVLTPAELDAHVPPAPAPPPAIAMSITLPLLRNVFPVPTKFKVLTVPIAVVED